MPLNSLKRNKSAIFGIPLIIILSGFVFYEYGFLNIQAQKESILDAEKVKMKTLGKYVSLISQKEHLEKYMSRLKELRAAQNSKMIDGRTVSLAAANLQSTVRNLISSRGGNISSERVEKPEDFGKFKIISISVDTVLPDARALANIVYAIETQTPYLFIKEMDSRIVNYSKPKDLLVKLKISALASGR